MFCQSQKSFSFALECTFHITLSIFPEVLVRGGLKMGRMNIIGKNEWVLERVLNVGISLHKFVSFRLSQAQVYDI